MIVLVVAFVFMGFFMVRALYEDYIQGDGRKITTLNLLGFAVASFLGVIFSLVSTGRFSIIFLLSIPIYIVLFLLNTFLNREKILGAGDVDILNVAISLLVCEVIYILGKDISFGQDLVLLDLCLGFCISLFVGSVMSLIFALVFKVVKKVKKGEKLPSSLIYFPCCFFMVWQISTQSF